jgi:hypothetical protein
MSKYDTDNLRTLTVVFKWKQIEFLIKTNLLDNVLQDVRFCLEHCQEDNEFLFNYYFQFSSNDFETISKFRKYFTQLNFLCIFVFILLVTFKKIIDDVIANKNNRKTVTCYN